MAYLPYLIIIGIIGFILSLWYHRKTNRLVQIIIAVTVFIGVGVYATESLNPKVEPSETIVTVTFIDVGQALSVLIRDNLGNDILYDGGNNQDAPFLIDYFQDLKIDDFETVIASHFHEDHIGGLDDILAQYKVDMILMPSIPYNTDDCDNLISVIDTEHIVRQAIKPNLVIKVGEISLKLIGPNTDFKDINSQSLMIQVIFQDKRILLTGDGTVAAEKLILNQNIQSDIIQIAHHGSHTSSSKAFLSAVSAQYAIVSVGLDNTYGLPDEDIIKRIHDLDMTLYRTDLMGSIIFTIKQNTITVNTYPTIGNK